jgi:hypothetical protein
MPERPAERAAVLVFPSATPGAFHPMPVLITANVTQIKHACGVWVCKYANYCSNCGKSMKQED